MTDDQTSDSETQTETEAEDAGELPARVVEEAERLTRRAREAVDEAERAGALRARDRLLAGRGFTARLRNEDNREVLVLYPAEWVTDGTVQPGRIDDLGRGVERPLSGAGEDDWASVDTHNRDLARTVERAHGEIHGANAQALADFAGNHYGKRIERLTGTELRLFLEEYYPRNVWPTDDQKAVVEESVRLVFEQTDESVSSWRRR
ncbi:MAG: hypothetical protein J07HX64_00642 [halophilic archaeon J07HX64]|jgi:hypothetical protein|nr:MAG: hypothetical protein J07HX64_00642 [halophilic archaeon J07HX64]